MDDDDVGMIQASDSAGLLLEAAHKGRIGQQRRVQNLQGHQAVEGGITGLKNGGKAAFTQPGDQFIFAEVFASLVV